MVHCILLLSPIKYDRFWKSFRISMLHLFIVLRLLVVKMAILQMYTSLKSATVLLLQVFNVNKCYITVHFSVDKNCMISTTTKKSRNKVISYVTCFQILFPLIFFTCFRYHFGHFLEFLVGSCWKNFIIINFASKLTREKKLAWQSSNEAPFVWVPGWLIMASSYFWILKSLTGVAGAYPESTPSSPS